MNIALGKRTWQPSVDASGYPKRAVDGGYNPDWAGNSCARTANQAYPWWAVDLEESYKVDRVIVYNRNIQGKESGFVH